MSIYSLNTRKSTYIIDKYGLNKISLFIDENKDILRAYINAIKILQYETIRILRQIKNVDISGVQLMTEGYKFLICCYELQNNYNINPYIETYYNNVLKWFHKNDILTYKKSIKYYKKFRYNKHLVNVKILDEVLKYSSFNNLEIDFGAYLGRKFLDWKKIKT